MSILEAIILGILQGLTEFIPVSSTAHLTLAGRAMGLVDEGAAHEWTAFLAVVQVGTLLAVIWYFWRDIVSIARAMLHVGTGREAVGKRRLGWMVVLATLPIVVLGLALKDVIEGPITKDLRVIAGALIGLAVILYVAERVGSKSRGIEEIGPAGALGVGLAQAIALVPGASRSGSTIMGGLFAGLTRESAARFSFLLSIPAIAGSAVFELPAALAARDVGVGALAAGVLAAAVVGYASIAFLLRWLRTRSTMVFIVYRLALGGTILALLAAGVIGAQG